MNVLLVGLAALSAAASIWTAPATAATFGITVKGTVAGGTDYAGLIGPALGDLTGMPFEMSYRFSYPAAGAVLVVYPETPFNEHSVSLEGFGTTSASAVILIGGYDFLISPGHGFSYSHLRRTYSNNDYVPGGPLDTRDFIFAEAQSDNIFANALIQNTSASHAQSGPDIFDSVDYQGIESGYEFGIGGDSFGNFDLYFAGDGFISFHGALVPEPSSWAVLILGFFATGAAIRGQRSGAGQRLYASLAHNVVHLR